ncbi:hypothetical protein F4560_002662 [Saccharothrix ecbatanensis]|uniref:Uncharacterized protein n=1 Tax=Saccharothrix ecbatanensis TaxID=1105145 RepID=A0A7W9HIG4_9PSEU|nr:hypothetical protein [Saccharothrix ecbatanensis]MBB5802894.1 hypothetical protein [Saccharothrix ecbatanensis]
MGTECIVSSMGLRPDATAPVRLYGSLGRTVFLTLGTAIEVTLHESHVLALRGDIATALGEMEAIDAAERIVERAYDAGAQARRAAELALERAESADRAGDVVQAARLREAAAGAETAASAAQTAAEAAEQAMTEAVDAMDRVTYTVGMSDAAAGLPLSSA